MSHYIVFCSTVWNEADITKGGNLQIFTIIGGNRLNSTPFHYFFYFSYEHMRAQLVMLGVQIRRKTGKVCKESLLYLFLLTVKSIKRKTWPINSRVTWFWMLIVLTYLYLNSLWIRTSSCISFLFAAGSPRTPWHSSLATDVTKKFSSQIKVSCQLGGASHTTRTIWSKLI